MILKVFKSAKDLTGDRIRNPLFGTYIVVWIVRNWELIYSLIYFDGRNTLADRITYIKNHFKDVTLLEELFSTLGITFAVIISSYLLLNLARLIANFSELKIKPFIDMTVDSKSVVTKERFNAMQVQRDELQSSVDRIRNSLSMAESNVVQKISEIDSLQSDIVKLGESEKAIRSDRDNFRNEIRELETEKEVLLLNDDSLRVVLVTHIDNLFNSLGGTHMLAFAKLYDKHKNENIIIIEDKDLKMKLINTLLIEEKGDDLRFTKMADLYRASIEITGKNSTRINGFEGIAKYLEKK